MKIDWQAFRRARVARDVRFDGKFFVGAHSTRIYCRPSCPVPTIPDKNVRYYPTAAAAAEAGFRPCLRCRPECSPGTPAWSGTSSTVSRALRLIEESGLEDGGMEGLAERLGMSDIAVASGFGCVRRFNAAIRKTYNRTPTHIRRLAQQNTIQQEDHYL